MEINSVYPSGQEEIKEQDLRSLWPKGQGEVSDVRSRRLAVIVAVGRDRAIGRNGDLIRHLPGDLARLKELTMDHAVIMGRKTWDSLPKKPLPGRVNIVISRNEDFNPDGAVRVSSLTAALQASMSDPMPFVIGGGMIYAEALPLATHLYLTELDADTPDADTFFPKMDFSEWEQTYLSDKNVNKQGETFRFADYVRKR